MPVYPVHELSNLVVLLNSRNFDNKIRSVGKFLFLQLLKLHFARNLQLCDRKMPTTLHGINMEWKCYSQRTLF